MKLWGDQTDFESEILCDYGATATIMLMLGDRYGPGFLGDLHRDDHPGFRGLQAVLDEHDPSMTVKHLVNEWAASAVLDGVLDEGASFDGPGARSDYRVGALDATVNWCDGPDLQQPGGSAQRLGLRASARG